MATVSYLIRGKSNPTKIICRYVNGRETTLQTSLNLFVNPKYWDNKQKRIKNVSVVKNRDDINRHLNLMQTHIIDYFNSAYMTGELIDSTLLKKAVNTYFNRPDQENINKNIEHTIYYVKFAEYWLKEKSSSWLVSANDFMSIREKKKYSSFLGMVKDYESKTKIRIRLRNIDSELINNFVAYLSDLNYSSSTIRRHALRFKFFCNRASELGHKVNPAYKQRVFIPKTQEVKKPYLNTNEIEKIYNYDFSYSKNLDNVRDNLIIACWTGLRVSDFLGRLTLDNFIDDIIEITTQKTNTNVAIPVHPMIKDILIKRKGCLPKKISDQKFNKYLKTVCEKVGIDNKMPGFLFDKESNRQKFGIYPKHKLISSHIGRRSFCTNLIGKIDDITIMGIAGWSKKEMMYKYVKLSGREHADKLKNYWEAQNIKNQTK
tara:strand:- start:757 stop:2049 length:1293 start_codon:yes stop_codon:yes gene_type:complete